MKTKSLPLVRKTLSMLLLIFIGFYGCKNKTNSNEENIDYQKVNHPKWSKNVSIYEVNIRQYTPEGTFNAFAQHLPRLKEMGVDILFSPFPTD